MLPTTGASASRGFPEVELTDGLRWIRDHEAARGLAQWPRMIMRSPLTD